MSQARAQTRTVRSGVERTNHEATAPICELHWNWIEQIQIETALPSSAMKAF